MGERRICCRRDYCRDCGCSHCRGGSCDRPDPKKEISKQKERRDASLFWDG